MCKRWTCDSLLKVIGEDERLKYRNLLFRTFWNIFTDCFQPEEALKRDKLYFKNNNTIMEEGPVEDYSKYAVVDPASLEALERLKQLNRQEFCRIVEKGRWAIDAVSKAARLIIQQREHLIAQGLLIAEDDLNYTIELSILLTQLINMIELQASVFGTDPPEFLNTLLQKKEELQKLIVMLQEQVKLDNELLKAKEKAKYADEQCKAAYSKMMIMRQRLKEKTAQLERRNNGVAIVCRIRPAMTQNIALRAISPFQIQSLTYKEDISKPKRSRHPNPQLLDKMFPAQEVWQIHEFDHVLGLDSTQQDAANEVLNLVDNALEGNQSCLILAGQTGSGKTYTLFGSKHYWKQNIADFDQGMGIAPRIIFQVFRRFQRNGFKIGVNCHLDLTISQFFAKIPGAQQSAFQNNGSAEKLSEKSSIGFRKKTYAVSNPRECLLYLYERLRNRRVGPTKKNDESSRSHMITRLRFMIKVEGKMKNGSISMIDLAGNQRPDEAPIIEETAFINQTTADLRECLRKIRSNDPSLNFSYYTYAKMFEAHITNAKITVFFALSSDQTEIKRTMDTISYAKKISP